MFHQIITKEVSKSLKKPKRCKTKINKRFTILEHKKIIKGVILTLNLASKSIDNSRISCSFNFIVHMSIRA